MRIAVFHNLPSGGAKRHTFEQVRELARRGHEIVEFAPSSANLKFCDLAPYVREQRIYDFQPVEQTGRRVPFLTPYIHAAQALSNLRQADELNRRIAVEIDNSAFDIAFVKDCLLIANPYLLRHLKTLNCFQCHDGLRLRKDRTPSRLSKASTVERLKDFYYGPARRTYASKFEINSTANIRSATLVLTNSNFSSQVLRETYGVESYVIYPGINHRTFRAANGDRADYVLCVGSLLYSKGYRFLLQALGRISEGRRPSLVVAADIIDPDEQRIVNEMADALDINLKIESVMDDRRLVHLYSHARLFLYAPMSEALGMAPLEAMACECPVVGVKEGGIRETVIDGETGYLVERDPAQFASRVEELLTDEGTRMRMGQVAAEYVRSSWKWSDAVDRLEQQLKTLL